MAVSVAAYEIGEIQSHGNLAVAPVLGSSGDLDYLVLKEALNDGLGVAEKPGGVDQNNIYLDNGTGKPVLAISGEIVTGRTQNRSLTRNVYLGRGIRTLIPVNCAEQGEPTCAGAVFNGYGGIAPSSVSSSRQGDAWSTIAFHLGETSVDSRTGDMSQVYSARRESFDQFAGRFSLEENQVGFVVALMLRGKKHFGLDIFDRANTFAKYFPDRLRGYILESGLGNEAPVSFSTEEAAGFLGLLESVDFRPISAVNLGDDFKIRGEGVLGSSLVYRGVPLYTNLFSNFGGQGRRVAAHAAIDTSETIINLPRDDLLARRGDVNVEEMPEFNSLAEPNGQ